MDNPDKFLVSIHCITYNQSAYITDAMDGFVMQQTKFPFVAVIIDDASTDCEQEVIKAYVEEHFDHSQESGFRDWETKDAFFTFARHKENKNCHFVAVYLKRNLFKEPEKKDAVVKEWFETKYIAICEGDDYWIDSLKLQKQVDFLEGHGEYSMCFHGAEIINQGVDKSITGMQREDIEDREYTSTEMFERWIVPTASIVYRKMNVECFKVKHPEWITRGDIVLVLRCSHTGKVFGLSDKMSVYRMQPNSISYSQKCEDYRIFPLPNQFRCIYINFPKVEKGPVVWNISHAYYVRMKNQKNFFLKIKDFFLFLYWDPQFAIVKIKKIVRRKK